MKKTASKVAKLAQIQPKSQFLFHKNLPPRNFYIMTLAATRRGGIFLAEPKQRSLFLSLVSVFKFLGFLCFTLESEQPSLFGHLRRPHAHPLGV